MSSSATAYVVRLKDELKQVGLEDAASTEVFACQVARVFEEIAEAEQPQNFEPSLSTVLDFFAADGSTCQPATEAFVKLVATTCTPREVVTLFLATLDQHTGVFVRRWGALDAILVQQLAVALSRIPRRRPQLLEDCLHVLCSTATAVLAPAAPAPVLGDHGADAAGCSEDDAEVSHTDTGAPPRDAAAFVLSMTRFLQASVQMTAGSHGNDEQSKQEVGLLRAFALHLLAVFVSTIPSAPPDGVLRGRPTFPAAAAVQQYAAAIAAMSELLLYDWSQLATCAADPQSLGHSSFLHSNGRVDVGEALMLFWNLCMSHVGPVGFPSAPLADTLLKQAIHSAQVLLDMAAEEQRQDVGETALHLISAASKHLVGAASAALVPAVLELSQELIFAAVSHPVQAVRQTALRATQVLLNALQPGGRLQVLQQLMHRQHPSIAALLLQCVKQVIDETWPAVPPAALELALAHLHPAGRHGWQANGGLTHNAEPICAALNIYRFVLQRQALTKHQLLDSTTLLGLKQGCLLPLQSLTAAALSSMDTESDGLPQSKTEVPAEGDKGSMLALSRVSEVLSAVLEHIKA